MILNVKMNGELKMKTKGKKKMKLFVVLTSLVVIFAIIMAVISVFNKAKFSFDDYLKELEKRIDKEKASLADKFEGGKCKIYAKGKLITSIADIYYTDNGSWQKKTITYSVSVSHFSSDESTSSKLHSLKNTSMNFDIT